MLRPRRMMEWRQLRLHQVATAWGRLSGQAGAAFLCCGDHQHSSVVAAPPTP
jgi:hypothetical protein